MCKTINVHVHYHSNSLVMKPEKVQLIQPPIIIIGRTLVKVPFIISMAIPGSVWRERDEEREREREREREIGKGACVCVCVCV